MRKIQTKEDVEKKQKRNNAIMVIFLVFILLGSTFGIIVNSFGNNSSSDSSTSLKYNGYDFVYQNNYWNVDLSGKTYSFLNSPKDTESLVLGKDNVSKTIQDYTNVPVYIYSEYSGAEIEIYRNIFQVAQRVQNACPQGINCSNDNLPVKDCSENLIIVQESTDSEIVQNKGCVYIRGPKENLIKESDEFMFKIFGIK